MTRANNLLQRLVAGDVLISDGATGTYLQSHGLEPGGCPEEMNSANPDIIRAMASDYFVAGADISEFAHFDYDKGKALSAEGHDKVFNFIENFEFDSILMPWNWFVAHYRDYPDDFNSTLKLCRKKNIAVQTIKAIARGPWAAGMKKSYSTWYQPLEDEESIKKSVHWVLSYKDIFLNSVGDVNILPAVLNAAEKLEKRPNNKDMNYISEKMGLSSIFGA